jgi:hypothetical protein
MKYYEFCCIFGTKYSKHSAYSIIHRPTQPTRATFKVLENYLQPAATWFSSEALFHLTATTML